MTFSKPTTWGIDGDILIYRIGFAAEEDPVEFALHSLRVATMDIMDAVGASTGHFYLTGDSNYRTEYGTEEHPYKGNRKDNRKPRHYDALRDYAVRKLDAIVTDNEEADDRLGIGACLHGHGIATLDKDLNGVPGWHYCWAGKNEGVFLVTEEEADRFFYKQLLTGDATDNIPGLFKMVGKKATAKVLDPIDDMVDVKDMYDYVRAVYMEGYEALGMCLDEKDEVVDNWLHRQARCLWIRRAEDQLWASE